MNFKPKNRWKSSTKRIGRCRMRISNTCQLMRTVQTKLSHQKTRIRSKFIKSNLVNSSQKLPSKSLRSILTQNKIETSLWSLTRWSTRLRCVGTGSCLKSASFKTNAHLLTGIMNYTKRSTSPKTIKQNPVHNSMRPLFVPMATGVNFYTLNTTLSTRRI